jgi:hypothetical protein
MESSGREGPSWSKKQWAARQLRTAQVTASFNAGEKLQIPLPAFSY